MFHLIKVSCLFTIIFFYLSFSMSVYSTYIKSVVICSNKCLCTHVKYAVKEAICNLIVLIIYLMHHLKKSKILCINEPIIYFTIQPLD